MNIALKIASPILFLANLTFFLFYTVSKRNSRIGYGFFRKSFASTGGASNDFLTKLVRRPIGKLSVKLNVVNEDELEPFKSSMDQKGYYVFESPVDESIVANIEKGLAILTPMKLDFKNNVYIRDEKFPKEISSPRYQYSFSDLSKMKIARELSTHSNLVQFASSYLKSEPICDLLACWYSYPFENSESRNSAAQMFHFDLDRLQFIKFFIYLTDVDIESGPHCYVEGSHKDLKWPFHRDGRFSDELVNMEYPNTVRYLTGKRGTIMAVDTRGLHRGVPLMKGKRLIYQIEFTNSLFGKPLEKEEEEAIERLN